MNRAIRYTVPECGTDKVRRPSQSRSFTKNPIASVPMQRLLSPHVELDPEQLLKILNQPSVIQEPPARLPSDE